MLLSVVILYVIGPLFFIGQVIFRLFHKDYQLWYYFRAISVGNDSVGGSVIYGSMLHTISGMHGYFYTLKESDKTILHKYFIKIHKFTTPILDKIFGANHCVEEAIEEQLIK